MSARRGVRLSSAERPGPGEWRPWQGREAGRRNPGASPVWSKAPEAPFYRYWITRILTHLYSNDGINVWITVQRLRRGETCKPFMNLNTGAETVMVYITEYSCLSLI